MIRNLLMMTVLVLSCHSAIAQTLTLQNRDNEAALGGREVPVRGMSMQAVEARIGAPLMRQDAVGNPPISSWRYDGFSVYFEGDRVLHTVADLPKN